MKEFFEKLQTLFLKKNLPSTNARIILIFIVRWRYSGILGFLSPSVGRNNPTMQTNAAISAT